MYAISDGDLAVAIYFAIFDDMTRYFCSTLICGLAADNRKCSPWLTTYARVGGDIVRELFDVREEYRREKCDRMFLSLEHFTNIGLLPPEWDYHMARGGHRHTVLDVPPEMVSVYSQLGGLYA